MTQVPSPVKTHTDEQYPINGSVSEQLTYLLSFAILAPSGHNNQPWRFHLDGDAVEVYADDANALPALATPCVSWWETLLGRRS